jgi:hypothetical protein
MDGAEVIVTDPDKPKQLVGRTATGSEATKCWPGNSGRLNYNSEEQVVHSETMEEKPVRKEVVVVNKSRAECFKEEQKKEGGWLRSDTALVSSR